MPWFHEDISHSDKKLVFSDEQTIPDNFPSSENMNKPETQRSWLINKLREG